MPNINLHATQSAVFKDVFVDNKIRFPVIVCSRGWGKSFEVSAAAVAALWELFELDAKVQNKRVAIIAPTYDQVRDIYYPVLTNIFELHKYAIKVIDGTRFIFPNDVELHLLSYEAVERMRGKGYYFIGIDEPSSMRNLQENWENIIYPCITSRWSWMHAEMYGARSAGRAMWAGTPKGFNFLETVSHYEEIDPEWKTYIHPYTDSPLLDPKEVLKAKDKMDPIRYASEYLASFKESGASLFYTFDRKKHVTGIEAPILAEVIHCCIDFNVSGCRTSFFTLRGKQMQFFDEYQGSPDTDSLAEYIVAKYGKHQAIHAYPDPSGKARKTSAVVGTTDFSILRSHGIKVLAKTQVPIVDSVNAVNRQLMTASKKVNMFFDPKGCPETIRSVERTKWVNGDSDLAVVDKSEGVEHYSDGIRYATDFLFPVNSATVGTAKGSTF